MTPAIDTLSPPKTAAADNLADTLTEIEELQGRLAELVAEARGYLGAMTAGTSETAATYRQ